MIPSTDLDRTLLAHILQCMDRIRNYTNGQRETFYGSHMVQDAVVRNLQILAESTQRLSEGLKTTEPAVPWGAIVGFRNILTHNYLGIDLNAVWSVVETDLPQLKSVTNVADACFNRRSFVNKRLWQTEATAKWRVGTQRLYLVDDSRNWGAGAARRISLRAPEEPHRNHA